MPDAFGFDHLTGAERRPIVRCIDCGDGGPLWRWPERLRERHFAKHEAARRRTSQAHAKQVQREATKRLRAVTQLRREARR